MKPIVIIAIAVVCSVVAVFAVTLALQEIAFYQYQEKTNKEQMGIVNEYNVEIKRCSMVFEYGNVLAKQQCATNAEKNFPIYLLDNEHKRMLESSITSEEYLIHSEKILEQIKKQNEEFYEQHPDLKP
jgi:hypothetical protein